MLAKYCGHFSLYDIIIHGDIMITSLTNEKIKEYAKLNQSKYRNETNMFLVEGPHLVEEARLANVLVDVITTDPNTLGILVNDAVMKKISNTVHPVKVIGVCKRLVNNKICSKVLALDEISDPTNLGTLLRSAKSFGFDTVFASNGSVDFYNDKVIRGSQGAIFKLNLLKGDLLEFLKTNKKTHQILGTDVRKGTDVSKIDLKENVILILGNEARGMRADANLFVDQNLFIQMQNMESLNVSVAGSILMYEIAKK